MKRVVGLMHRQAVKAKAEGLFFKVRGFRTFGYISSGRAIGIEKRVLLLRVAWRMNPLPFPPLLLSVLRCTLSTMLHDASVNVPWRLIGTTELDPN